MTGSRRYSTGSFPRRRCLISPMRSERVSYMDGCKVYFAKRGMGGLPLFRHRAPAAHLRRDAGGKRRGSVASDLWQDIPEIVRERVRGFGMIKNRPQYDPGFLPLGAYKRARTSVDASPYPLCIAVEREDGLSAMELRLRGTGDEEDCLYAERMAKTLLWQKGGYRLYVCGPNEIYRYIANAYTAGGSRRQFDADFMADVYRHPFEVIHREYGQRPAPL